VGILILGSRGRRLSGTDRFADNNAVRPLAFVLLALLTVLTVLLHRGAVAAAKPGDLRLSDRERARPAARDDSL